MLFAVYYSFSLFTTPVFVPFDYFVSLLIIFLNFALRALSPSLLFLFFLVPYVAISMGRRNRPARGPNTRRSSKDGDREEELDLEQFSASLAREALGIRDVRRDGNCFFRAVSDQLYGTEEHHAYLRGCACDYMQRNEELLTPFLADTDDSFSSYVDDMRCDGVWAGNLEVQAISMVCVANIRIHQSAKPSYDIRNHTSRNARVIHLSYHFGEHYASVRPLHQLHHDTPALHNPLPPLRALSESRISRDATPERRPRRPGTNFADVAAIWNKAEKTHSDVMQLIEHAENAARFFRRPSTDETVSDDTKWDLVRQIERDVKYTNDLLIDVQNRIHSWKRAHAVRMQRLEASNNENDSDPSETDASDQYESCSDGYGWESDSDNQTYDRQIKREKKILFDELDEAETRLSGILRRASDLRRQLAGDGPSGKVRHQAKKREQEAKRKERKARRRQQQERDAREAAQRTDAAIDRDDGEADMLVPRNNKIEVWSVHPEVSI